jgi:hypothetical protein
LTWLLVGLCAWLCLLSKPVGLLETVFERRGKYLADSMQQQNCNHQDHLFDEEVEPAYCIGCRWPILLLFRIGKNQCEKACVKAREKARFVVAAVGPEEFKP